MIKFKKIKEISIDHEYCPEYSIYKLSNLWINSRLKKSIDMAAYKGTELFNVNKSNFLWNYFPNIDNYFDDSLLIDYDFRYYIIRDVYGWAIPAKEDINLILKYSQDRDILDLGCGCGLWAKILSHYKRVLPVDLKVEDSFDFEYIDIINADAVDVLDENNGQFVILNYPRKDVIENVFENANVGTRFYINIPFIAMDFDIAIIDWIISSSRILDDNISGWLDLHIDKFQGVVIEKTKDVSFLDYYEKHKKKDINSIIGIKSPEMNWRNFRRIYLGKSNEREYFSFWL